MNGNMATRYAKKAGIEIENSIFYDDIVSAPKELKFGILQEKRFVRR